MNDLIAEDLAEITDLAARVSKLSSRRRFVTHAAKAMAFVIPASVIMAVPSDALAAGSDSPGGMGMMGMGMMGMM